MFIESIHICVAWLRHRLEPRWMSCHVVSLGKVGMIPSNWIVSV